MQTKSNLARVNGIELGYQEFGSGKPLMLLHGGFKLQTREEFQHLREDAAYSIQGGDLRPVEIAFGEAHLNLSGLPPLQFKI